MEKEPHRYKGKLVERYEASLKPIEKSLHCALLEIDDSVRSGKHFMGTVWRQIAVNLEKTATFCEISRVPTESILLEAVPNGKIKLADFLDNDHLSIKSRRIPEFTLYGISGLLKLVDIHRLSHVFRLCRHLLTTTSNFPLVAGNGKKVSGVINVITSMFGDSALHRQINPHPSSLHIYRVFIASATDAALISDLGTNSGLIDGVVTAIAKEIYSLKLAGTVPGNTDSIFGVSISTQMAMSFDNSVPFIYLDRFLSYDKLKTFVKRVLFDHDSRCSDEAELVLNCFIVNDFENTQNDIHDLPLLFPAHIHYSWAMVKPSSANEVFSTVLHGGQPPLSLMFSSVFDDLSSLTSYQRLFDSPQSVNSMSIPNDVYRLRHFYQDRLANFASNRSFDNLFDLSVSLLAYGCSIGPPVSDLAVDSNAQAQLIDSVSSLFSSNASALRSLINYGLALGICGSRFVGANEITSSGNGSWYVKACYNFAHRINGFFGVDKLHYRTVPTADSSPLTNILLTTAAAILPTESSHLPVCMTGLPNIIAGIAMYAQVYWLSVSTACTLTNCHYLFDTIANLRNYRSANGFTDQLMSEVNRPKEIRQIVGQFMNYPSEKRPPVLGRETSRTYLRNLVLGNFHSDYTEMCHEMMMVTLTSTPKPAGETPDTRIQAPNDSWLSIGARLVKFACVRSYAFTSDGFRAPSAKKHYHSKLGAHPAVQHHLSHCHGCTRFSSRILKVTQFLIPRAKVPPCFKPVLALSGSSALRCSYVMPDSLMAPIQLSLFWLPAILDVELVAAPLDSIAETVTQYLSSLCVHGTPVQLLSFRFVVLNSLTATEEEDLTCYEVPPVEVALPVAFRDLAGCAMELHRWWSVSPRHRVLLRGMMNIAGHSNPNILFHARENDPCLLEFLVDIRPCFTPEFVTSFRPFDRINNIFSSMEDFNHFQQSFVRLASVNNANVIGFGVDEYDNAVTMAAFFNHPLLPFAQRQLDIDLHNRYAVAMASSNWFEAAFLAHWHAILIPITNDQCNCVLLNTEAIFRNSMTFVPLLRLPVWLRGLSSLVLYCRDSLMMALNFSSATTIEINAEMGPLSTFTKHMIRRQETEAPNTEFCATELEMVRIIAENIYMATTLAASKKSSDPDTIFANEPTGYSAVVWAVACDYINHAIECVVPDAYPYRDQTTRWQNMVDRFCAAAHDLSKLSALILGYGDSVSYYHVSAFARKFQMLKNVSSCCVGDPSGSADRTALPRGIFRYDVVSLTRTPVYE